MNRPFFRDQNQRMPLLIEPTTGFLIIQVITYHIISQMPHHTYKNIEISIKLFIFYESQLIIDNNPALMKTPQTQDLGTAIILATEQLFKKKFKATVTAEREYLSWTDLLHNPNIKRLLLKEKTMNAQEEKKNFYKKVIETFHKHPLYSIEKIKQNEKTNAVIKRYCCYAQIKDCKTLCEYVSRHYNGTLVDDEMLSFTYPSISKDIQNAVNHRFFVRMYLQGRNTDTYYLFYNMEEYQFGIKDWETNEYQTEYLELCKEFGKKEERVFEEGNGADIQLEVDNSDPNYKLPNFLELKKQWKIKQTLKLASQVEEEKKAERQEIEKNTKKP